MQDVNMMEIAEAYRSTQFYFIIFYTINTLFYLQVKLSKKPSSEILTL
jgi:hypothetical protein